MGHWPHRKLRKVDTLKGWHLTSWHFEEVGRNFIRHMASSMEGLNELATLCMKRSCSCTPQAFKTVSHVQNLARENHDNILEYQM
jgi:hypothetical protein